MADLLVFNAATRVPHSITTRHFIRRGSLFCATRAAVEILTVATASTLFMFSMH